MPIEAQVVDDAENDLTSKLRDLRKARDQGLLTENEYAQARKDTLKGLTGGGGGGAATAAAIVSQPKAANNYSSHANHSTLDIHPKAGLVTGGMILVRRGSQMACVFSEAERLRAGETVPLTLASHPGKSIGKRYHEERRYGEWRYIESEVTTEPIHVRLEGKFIKLADADLVFDVAFWKFQENNAVNFVGGNNHGRTYLHGGGRDWTINEDGTISSSNHPDLVLGTYPPPGVWTASFPRISTSDIAGDWACCCIPGGWACFEKVANGEDKLIHRGCVCLFFWLPCPFEEHRTRVPNTNGFRKDGDPGNIDTYNSPGCACNGIACNIKLS